MRKAEAVVANRVIERSTGSAGVSVQKDPRPSGLPEVGPDRRALPRYEVALQITLFGDHNFYVGLSENLSEGGLFVRTQNVLPIGTPIRMEFTLPTSAAVVAVVGEVRWVRSGNAARGEYDNFGSGSDDTQAGMGVQFKEMTPEASAAIAKYVSIRKPDFFEE